jgi:hypothetical protein
VEVMNLPQHDPVMLVMAKVIEDGVAPNEYAAIFIMHLSLTRLTHSWGDGMKTEWSLLHNTTTKTKLENHLLDNESKLKSLSFFMIVFVIIRILVLLSQATNDITAVNATAPNKTS